MIGVIPLGQGSAILQSDGETMTATEDMTGREIVANDFRAAEVFQRHGIDFCCRGNRSVEDLPACLLELEAFERDLDEHVHLENNILFPRALQLESERWSDVGSAPESSSSRPHLLGLRQVLSGDGSRLREWNDSNLTSERAVWC